VFVSIKDFLWTSILQIYHHKMVVITCARHNIQFLCEGAPHRGKKVSDCSCLTNKRTTTCLYLRAMRKLISGVINYLSNGAGPTTSSGQSVQNFVELIVQPNQSTITPTFFIVIWCNVIPLMQQIHGQVQLNVSQVLYI